MDKQEDGFESDTALQKQEWARTQDVLKSRLVLEDDFEWSLLPLVSSDSDQGDAGVKLKYIGGVDISFLKEDPSTACAAVVVLDAETLEIVHEEFDLVRMQVPYIPGFLAFREAPILLGLLEKMKSNVQQFYPQLLMVDGNGLLHPRGRPHNGGDGHGIANGSMAPRNRFPCAMYTSLYIKMLRIFLFLLHCCQLSQAL